jgi:flagellar basal-body rod protein FlgG
MYSRNGSFTIRPDRTLVTQSGDPVLAVGGGTITIPDSGEIYINSDGEIRVGDQLIATLRVVSFENLEELRAHGYNLFRALPTAIETPATIHVQQGFLEASNVNVVREMVNMINVSRAYELNQRMVSIHDTILGQAVSEIARR